MVKESFGKILSHNSKNSNKKSKLFLNEPYHSKWDPVYFLGSW